MSSVYHENGITTSQVDYFCLVCECYIKNKEDADSHIIKPVHKKCLLTFDYCEQFREDHIRKVKNGYFCEFCNILFPTTAKVKLHLQDNKHINTRGNQLLVKIGNIVTAFGKIRISESAWNGFIDQICTLCNIEFEKEDIHKTTSSHLINLIHKKVEFTSKNDIYRKIDEDSFQCLTCHKELALSTLTDHFDDDFHKTMYEKCLESYKDSNNNENTGSPEAKSCDNKSLADDNKNNDIPLQTKDKQNKPVGNNNGADTGDANKKGAIPKTPVSSSKKTKDKITKPTALEIDERICKELNAKNYIIRDLNGNFHCILCSMNFEVSPAEHLSTMHHQALTKMHKERLQNNYESSPVNNQNKTTDAVISNKSKTPNDKDVSKILDSVSALQKQDININFETYVASCKKCTQVIDFDFDAIQNHIDSHKNKPKVEKAPQTFDCQPFGLKKGFLFASPVQKKNVNQDKTSTVSSCDDSIDELASKNNLCHDPKRNCLYCELCKASVPMAKKNILEHVNGFNHKCNQSKNHSKSAVVKIQKPKDEVPCPRRVLQCDFVKIASIVQDSFCHYFIINQEFCITFLSFVFLQKGNLNSTYCGFCDKTYLLHALPGHMLSHAGANESIPVVLVKSEYIREIRNKFHCGYCNTLVDSWADMTEHLMRGSHKDCKNSAMSRLEYHKGRINNQLNEDISFMEMLGRLQNRRFF